MGSRPNNSKLMDDIQNYLVHYFAYENLQVYFQPVLVVMAYVVYWFRKANNGKKNSI